MTGAGTTASRLGLPDLAFASQDDFVANATMIAGVASAKGVPVIADADTGFGGSAQIARTVQRYVSTLVYPSSQMLNEGHTGSRWSRSSAHRGPSHHETLRTSPWKTARDGR